MFGFWSAGKRGCGFMTLPDKFMPPKLHMQPPSWVVKPTGKAESPKGRHSLNGNNKVAQAFNTLSVAFALSGRIYHATRAPDYFDKLSKWNAANKLPVSEDRRQPDRQTPLFGPVIILPGRGGRSERAPDRRQVYLCYDLNTANDSQTRQHLSGGTADT